MCSYITDSVIFDSGQPQILEFVWPKRIGDNLFLRPYADHWPHRGGWEEADRIVSKIQREAAGRICALPGDEEYNFFSLFCRFHAQLEPLFDVPPSCFVPAPKVTSTVLRITPRPVPEEVEDPAFFLTVARAAFAQRRKTLVNALSSVTGGKLGKQQLGQCLIACGLPADVRGERLGIEEFARVAREVRRQMQA